MRRGIPRWAYQLLYRVPIPIGLVFGSDAKITGLLEHHVRGQVAPCRAAALGCGVGREAIWLARQGFEVTGVDFSPVALARARRLAEQAGVRVDFIQDDLTELQRLRGPFELVLDFGALNDLNAHGRDLYMTQVPPLVAPQGTFLMFGFDSKLPPKEVERRFGGQFDVEHINKEEDGLSQSMSLYRMVRRDEGTGPG